MSHRRQRRRRIRQKAKVCDNRSAWGRHPASRPVGKYVEAPASTWRRPDATDQITEPRSSKWVGRGRNRILPRFQKNWRINARNTPRRRLRSGNGEPDSCLRSRPAHRVLHIGGERRLRQSHRHRTSPQLAGQPAGRPHCIDRPIDRGSILQVLDWDPEVQPGSDQARAAKCQCEIPTGRGRHVAWTQAVGTRGRKLRRPPPVAAKPGDRRSQVAAKLTHSGRQGRFWKVVIPCHARKPIRRYRAAMSSTPFIETSLVSGPVQPGGFDLTPTAGAEVVFLGRTRGERHERHGDLQHLDYEAHPEMAARLLQELAEQAADQWPLHAVRLRHATGVVAPGEASVAIEVLSGHRAEAFEACRWLIDTLKVRLPIWKREVWSDGTTWVNGTPVRPST